MHAVVMQFSGLKLILFGLVCHMYQPFHGYHFAKICIVFHGSPPAIDRLSSGLFQEVIITNTLPVAEKNYFPQLTVLSVANLLGETIWRVHDDCSVSSIFQ